MVMGLGIHGGGAGAAEFFSKLGAKVRVTDLKLKKELRLGLEKLKKYPIQYVLGRHRSEDFKWADYVVKNPSVPLESPYLKLAKKLKKPILNDAAIFFETVGREKIIGITGTKGKSTTVKLLAEFLKNKYKVLATGLPGTSPLADIRKAVSVDKIILELSSFDLDLLKTSPAAAVITTIFPDHLNRYKTFSHYLSSKKNIFRWQEKNNVLFLNKDDKNSKKLAKEAKGKVIWFRNCGSLASKLEARLPSNISPTSLNAAIAAAEYFGISENNIKKTIKKFKPLEGRFEKIGERKGVIFINDTTSTNPGATLFNLKKLRISYFRKVYLILGGENKGFKASDYKELVDFLAKNRGKFKIALLVGSASELLKKNKNWRKLDVLIETDKLEKAITMSLTMSFNDIKDDAKRGRNIILLSPAAASFNLFSDEFHRGRVFKKAFLKLRKGVK